MNNKTNKALTLAAVSMSLATTASAAWLGTGTSSTFYYGGALVGFTNDSATDLLLTGQFNLDAAGSGSETTYAVYTRPGELDWVNNDYSTAEGWTLLGTDTVNTNAQGNWTTIDVGNTYTVSAGESVSIGVFYVSGEGYIGYSSGSTTNSNADATINAGIAKGIRGATLENPDGFFSDGFKPRTWSGEVQYEAVLEPATMVVLGGLAALAARRQKEAKSLVRL